jgi:hypothetical protein
VLIRLFQQAPICGRGWTRGWEEALAASQARVGRDAAHTREACAPSEGRHGSVMAPWQRGELSKLSLGPRWVHVAEWAAQSLTARNHYL